MKKTKILFASLLSSMLLSFSTYAGTVCTVDTLGCPPPNTLFLAICPQQLAAANVGDFYDETATIYMPAQVALGALGNFDITSVKMTSISGLPNGITAVFNESDSTYNPLLADRLSQYACVRLSGFPCGGNDTINFTINTLLTVLDFEIPFPINGSFVLNSPYNTLEVSSVNSSFLCLGGEVDLLATSGFTAYEWSNGQTSSTATVSTPGVYQVTATYNLSASSCQEVATKEVNNLDAVVNASTNNQSITACPNQKIVLQGFGGDQFTWSPTANLEIDFDKAVIIGLTSNETFKLVVSNNDCSDSLTVAVTIDNTCNQDGNCTPDLNCNPASGTYTCSNLPNITADEPYDASITFKVPGSLTADEILAIAGLPISLPPGLIQGLATIDSFSITNVLNLPNGINWAVDQTNSSGENIYFPSAAPGVTDYGCIRFFGETCDSAGIKDIVVELSVYVTLPPTIPFPLPNPNSIDLELPVTINYTNPLSVTASVQNPVPVDSTVVLTGASGFTNYTWNPGNVSGSSISVTNPGTYTLSAIANGGTCAQIVSYTVSFATGIENIDIASVNIFPNPNQGSFAIDFDMKKSADVEVAVFNMQGKEVYAETFAGKAGLNNKAVQMSNLSQGIYMVKLKADGNAVTKRVTLF